MCRPANPRGRPVADVDEPAPRRSRRSRPSRGRTEGRPRVDPVIWPSSTRARAAMLGRLMPNAPATVPMFASRAITSVQMPPFGLIGRRASWILARVAAVRVVGGRGARGVDLDRYLGLVVDGLVVAGRRACVEPRLVGDRRRGRAGRVRGAVRELREVFDTRRERARVGAVLEGALVREPRARVENERGEDEEAGDDQGRDGEDAAALSAQRPHVHAPKGAPASGAAVVL